MLRFDEEMSKEEIKEIRETFRKDADIENEDHAQLVRLGKAGWNETCPSEFAWHFDHPKFPGVRVTWRHDGQILISR